MIINPVINNITEPKISSASYNPVIPVNNTLSFWEVMQRSSMASGITAGVSVNSLTSGNAEFDSYFREAGALYDINPNLLIAVAQVESNFRPHVTSPVGAQGIMQIMPATARYLGVTNPFDAKQSIMGGAKYLKENLERFNGDVRLALAAYNAGWPAVKRHGGIPPFRETQNYVVKVMNLFGNESTSAGVTTELNIGNVNINNLDTTNSNNLNDLLKQVIFSVMLNIKMNNMGTGR